MKNFDVNLADDGQILNDPLVYGLRCHILTPSCDDEFLLPAHYEVEPLAVYLEATEATVLTHAVHLADPGVETEEVVSSLLHQRGGSGEENLIGQNQAKLGLWRSRSS